MIGWARRRLGLLGLILAILLVTVGLEFGVSTFVYERAENYTLRDDEARRLAEHLVIARRVVDEHPPRERPGLADELTTDRYTIRWTAAAPPLPPPAAPALDATRRRILAWEPSLAGADLRLRLVAPGRGLAIAGELRLADGSWLAFSAAGIAQSWDAAIRRIALGALPALLVILLGGLFIRRALAPLRLLARASRRVGTGGATLLDETGTSEVRQLVRAFNLMQLRIQKLIDERTQALAAVGHDLRTPLARARLRIDALGEGEAGEAIGRDIDETVAMIASLLAFLGGEGDPEPSVRTDVAVLAATVVDDAADHGGDARYDGPAHADATIRPIGIKRALVNLVENAIHYGERARVALLVEEARLVLRVDDDGPGIAEKELKRVLEPFARLDHARARNTEGLGLGLAIAARAIEREGGRLTLANRTGGGLRVEVALPLTGQPARPGASTRDASIGDRSLSAAADDFQ